MQLVPTFEAQVNVAFWPTEMDVGLTEKATVLLTFRRRNVTSDDVLAALDEVKGQILSKSDPEKQQG